MSGWRGPQHPTALSLVPLLPGRGAPILSVPEPVGVFFSKLKVFRSILLWLETLKIPTGADGCRKNKSKHFTSFQPQSSVE